ncbi:MAG: ABC transporter permease [Oscillospiraceae bacterium]|nr:ABC transporter permease [Oscillospiraceae bacterium]
MKTALFPTLAWTGIRKNRKLYLPYILSCIGSVMMSYIIEYLTQSPAVAQMHGGGDLMMILQPGKIVVLVFSALFLTYTNAFLTRRRNREFGLYNVLGMDKRCIGRIVAWESLAVSGISLAAGLGLGIAFSKLAELLLLYIIRADVDYTFSVPLRSVGIIAAAYALIFLWLLLKSLYGVHRSDPLALLHSENVGEKPPKGNRVLAVFGVLLLAAAYFLAVYVQSPITAVSTFLIAVLMVIAATYLLFISGSVALCRMLQKNKSYYYNKKHFVSVSSMAYRMKRNGAGLATVCILSTMVLVMIASSASLYFGAEDSIRSRFPQENSLDVEASSIGAMTQAGTAKLRAAYENVFADHGVTAKNVTAYAYATITGLQEPNGVDPDASQAISSMIAPESLRTLYFVPLSDYNKMMGTNLVLNGNEARIGTVRCDYDKQSFTMGDVTLNVIGALDKTPEMGNANTAIIPTIYFVVRDLDVLTPLEKLADYNGDKMLKTYWYYGYDLGFENEEAVQILKEQKALLGDCDFAQQADGGYTYYADCLAAERSDFYSMFGGLFFIGVLLSVLFMAAMVMIIYYKQISEGYEDQAGFAIMQKVGMTKADIRKSVNAQILTVFFAPLLMAGLHLAFAFTPIWKLLQLFNLHNLPFVIGVSAVAFVLFGVLYALIYKTTAKAYFHIVSDAG